MSLATTLQQTAEVFGALREFAVADEHLADFRTIVCELETQAIGLARGNRRVPSVQVSHPPRIPSRAHAKRFVEIMARLPSLEDDVDEATRLAYGRLLENLVIGVTGAIYTDFPELVPHDKNALQDKPDGEPR